MDDLVVGDFFIGNGDLAAFDTARGLDDDGVVLFELLIVGVKVVDLAYLLEPDADYFCHVILLYCELSHVCSSCKLMLVLSFLTA